MKRSFFMLGISVCLLCQFSQANQYDGRSTRNLEANSDVGVDQPPTQPIEGAGSWGESSLNEELGGPICGRDESVVFRPLIREGFLVELTWDNLESRVGSVAKHIAPNADSNPPVARALKPLLASPLNSATVRQEENHIALVSGSTEIGGEESSPSIETNDSQSKTKHVHDGSELESASNDAKLTEQIEEFKKSIGSDEQMDKAKKSTRLEKLTTAQNLLIKANGFRIKKSTYNHQLEDYPDELERLSHEAGEIRDVKPFVIKESDSSNSLQIDLQPWLKLLEDERKHLTELENDMAQLNNRITEIPSIRATAAEELVTVEESLSKVSRERDDIDVQLVQAVLSAEQFALNAELEMLDSEARRQELIGKLLPMQRDQASREIKRLEAHVSEYETAITNLRRIEIKLQAEEARSKAIDAHSALKDIANRNQELTQLRSNITERIQTAIKELDQVNSLVDVLGDSKKQLEDRIEVAGGVTHSNGMLLVESRRQLVPPFESKVRIKSIQSELQSVNIARQTLEEERKPLADPVEYIDEQIGKSDILNSDRERLLETGVKFAQTKRQYLDDLLNDYSQFRALLGQLEASRKELVAQINENRDYIDKMALWVRNSDPISMSDVRESEAGIRAFFAPKEWETMGKGFANRVSAKPHETALGVCGLLMVALMTRRLKQKD